MNDTTIEILNKQREIIYQKSTRERFRIGAELIDFGRRVVISNIKRNNPDISEIDLKIAVFKRYYENEFPKEELNLIINAIIKYWEKSLP